jgi:glutaryl-CoA dehydrogenase (non-decarboxylating)
MATALFIKKHTPGFSIKPIAGMLGFRSAMLAELEFVNCCIPAENIIGKPGFGFSHIAGTALDLGRYGIAWGAVGLSRACLEASIKYAKTRHQFGSRLGDHQMIQSMLARMITETKAAGLLCLNAGYLKDCKSPEAIMETVIAKYYASKVAMKSEADAVQIHGANGCSSEYPVQRYFRDAKIMEIIEGSSQIQKILIATHGLKG